MGDKQTQHNTRQSPSNRGAPAVPGPIPRQNVYGPEYPAPYASYSAQQMYAAQAAAYSAAQGHIQRQPRGRAPYNSHRNTQSRSADQRGPQAANFPAGYGASAAHMYSLPYGYYPYAHPQMYSQTGYPQMYSPRGHSSFHRGRGGVRGRGNVVNQRGKPGKVSRGPKYVGGEYATKRAEALLTTDVGFPGYLLCIDGEDCDKPQAISFSKEEIFGMHYEKGADGRFRLVVVSPTFAVVFRLLPNPSPSERRVLSSLIGNFQGSLKVFIDSQKMILVLNQQYGLLCKGFVDVETLSSRFWNLPSDSLESLYSALFSDNLLQASGLSEDTRLVNKAWAVRRITIRLLVEYSKAHRIPRLLYAAIDCSCMITQVSDNKLSISVLEAPDVAQAILVAQPPREHVPRAATPKEFPETFESFLEHFTSPRALLFDFCFREHLRLRRKELFIKDLLEGNISMYSKTDVCDFVNSLKWEQWTPRYTGTQTEVVVSLPHCRDTQKCIVDPANNDENFEFAAFQVLKNKFAEQQILNFRELTRGYRDVNGALSSLCYRHSLKSIEYGAEVTDQMFSVSAFVPYLGLEVKYPFLTDTREEGTTMLRHFLLFILEKCFNESITREVRDSERVA